MRTSMWANAALALVLAGCAEDIRPDEDEDDQAAEDDGEDDGDDQGVEADAGETPAPDATVDGPIRVVDNGDGTATITVDATDEEKWVYVDLGELAHVEPADPATSADWDLGMQRFHFALDGGISGAGEGELAVADGAALADVTEAPADGWSTDAADDPKDEDALPELAFETAADGWYDYNFMSHVLSPKERVYAVRGGAGDLFAMQIEAYYDDAGSPAWLRFTVKPLEE
jgi:HmuY protein